MQHTDHTLIFSGNGPIPDAWWDAWRTSAPQWARNPIDPDSPRSVLRSDKARAVAALMRSLPEWSDFRPHFTFAPVVWRETTQGGARWWAYDFEIGVRLDDVDGPYRLDYLPSERAVILRDEDGNDVPLGDLADDVEPGTRLTFDTLAEAQRAVYALHTYMQPGEDVI